jgi:ABC-type microcin C transport system duplicated ATPase subunit YejF
MTLEALDCPLYLTISSFLAAVSSISKHQLGLQQGRTLERGESRDKFGAKRGVIG